MEADLAREGHDFRDFYRPRGGASRLTLRRLAVLMRFMPREAHHRRAVGGDGFSQLELLVMESGLSGPVNPRHPWQEAERAQESQKVQLLKDRQAYYAAVAASQQVTDPVEGADPAEDGEQDQRADD